MRDQTDRQRMSASGKGGGGGGGRRHGPSSGFGAEGMDKHLAGEKKGG